MINQATHMLDFWGAGVTPGHAYYCADGKFKGQHVPLMDILRTDGAIMQADGTMVRAATGCEVGCEGDQFIHVITGDKGPDGNVIVSGHKKIRAGTRIYLEDDKHYSVLDLITANGGNLTSDDLIQKTQNGSATPLHWTFSDSIPNPEDHILERSEVTLEEIYAAGEWEQIGTRLAAPDGMAELTSTQTNMPLQPSKPEPNVPPAFANHPDAPTRPERSMNRKERKAMHAHQRKAAKARKRLVN